MSPLAYSFPITEVSPVLKASGMDQRGGFCLPEKRGDGVTRTSTSMLRGAPDYAECLL